MFVSLHFQALSLFPVCSVSGRKKRLDSIVAAVPSTHGDDAKDEDGDGDDVYDVSLRHHHHIVLEVHMSWDKKGDLTAQKQPTTQRRGRFCNSRHVPRPLSFFLRSLHTFKCFHMLVIHKGR